MPIHLVEDRRGREADAGFATSPLVRMEAYVEPLRDGDTMLHRRYEKAIATCALLGFGASTFDRAALLRARFGLRTPDAPHLACAQLHDCTAPWTDDRRLHDAARGLAVTIGRDG